ncbi:MAG: hypothetical protein K8R68_03110, partial [Bacteroidales bacterium]|nr:hypothetical protein [Bacteroidales bacterium]
MKKLTTIFQNLLIPLYTGKKIIALIVSINMHLLLQADGVIVNSSSERTLSIEVSAEIDLQFVEKEFSDGNIYSRFLVNGTARVAEGKPGVPGFARWILIPNGTTVNISTTYGTPIIYENIYLAPVQPEPYDNKDAPLPPFTKDEKIYSTNADFPGVFAETENIKHKRGQALTKLWIYPYQYNPVQRKLTVYPNMNVTVNFTGTINPIPDNLKSENLIRSLKSMAINADPILLAEENAKKSLKGKDGTKADGCELLIITHPDYEDAANTLASWKIRRGIFTWVVTTNTTGGTMNQIENYIDNAYDNWYPAPDYLLFIGDAEDIPVGYIINGTDDLGTDIFYADYDDPPDYVADFGYGRLSVDNSADADSVVARIIRYERFPTNNPGYYDQTLNAGCFQDGELLDPPPHELPDDIANRRFCKTLEDVRNYLMSLGYSSQREYIAYNRVNNDEIFPLVWNDINQTYTFIFENDNPPNGGLPIPVELQKPGFPWDGSTANVTAAFNTGKYFALYRAHGSRGGWGDPGFHREDVDALTNGENRPFIWSITCQSGWFDNETDLASNNTDVDSECFAEHWIRHNTGGSCGVLAASRNSTSGLNDRFIWGMMDAIWPDFLTWCLDPYGGSDPIYKMGDVINYGKEYMASKYAAGGGDRTIALYHWFGDPTSEMWTSQPNELTSAEATSIINIGTSSIAIQVYPAIEDMLVAICSENYDSIFGTAYTNASGIATVSLNHSITIADPLYITITKHNYKPYEFQAGWNVPGIWKGTISTDWHNANNWTYNQIPDFTSDIYIPAGCTNYPVINAPSAECKSLEIISGATLNIGNTTLNVYGDIEINGELGMISGAADLIVSGAVSWEDGSTANITSSTAMIEVFDAWSFQTGSAVHLDNGYVKFSGNLSRGIKCLSDDSYFNHIII